MILSQQAWEAYACSDLVSGVTFSKYPKRFKQIAFVPDLNCESSTTAGLGYWYIWVGLLV